MTAYYNEIDESAIEWLRNNIRAGLIADGEIDTRSIKEVQVDDLGGFTQHHFFAGIGGWSYAARLAGWPDDLPLWTASCPCQPFSAAGKGLGADDPRHLWPDLYRLWRAFRPLVGVGEQVSGKAGRDWFDGVRSDLARDAIDARACDVPALTVDAPHERNRLYWLAVADSDSEWQLERSQWQERLFVQSRRRPLHGDAGGNVVDLSGIGWREGRPEHEVQRGRPAAAKPDGACVTQGDAVGSRLEGYGGNVDGGCGRSLPSRSVAATDGRNGTFWSGADWLLCHDGKARRVADASASLLVDGVRGRVPVHRPAGIDPAIFPEEVRWVSRIGLWKGFGNGIVAQLAAEHLGAVLDVHGDWLAEMSGWRRAMTEAEIVAEYV